VERTAPDFRPAASLTEQIAEHIAEEIIRGRLAPQERIRELRVAQSLGVSRGSVREALLLLERRHLVEIVPRRGAVVSDLSRRQLDDLYDLLETLYGRVAARMAELWDEEDLPEFARRVEAIEAAAACDDVDGFAEAGEAFLDAALGMVRNQYLDAVLEALMPVSRRALHRVRALDDDALVNGAAHWRALLDAISAQDRAAVDDALAGLFSAWREGLTRALCH
jgi:DNA-binding GntR family transcriptional regulator